MVACAGNCAPPIVLIDRIGSESRASDGMFVGIRSARDTWFPEGLSLLSVSIFPGEGASPTVDDGAYGAESR